MKENDEEISKRILKLKEYFRKRGDTPEHFEYGISYFITLKDSRNSELSELLSKYVDLHTSKGRKVLDIGCGTGSFSAFLQEKGIDAYGIDVDTKLVQIAFTKNILVSDVHTLPFKDETFDAVVAFDVIEHLQNQKTAIQNMLSKTKPGGKIILLTNNRLFPFDTDTKLFFINYLPKSLATTYLRFRRKNPTLEYDNKNPTYFSFAKLCNKRLEHKI